MKWCQSGRCYNPISGSFDSPLIFPFAEIARTGLLQADKEDTLDNTIK